MTPGQLSTLSFILRHAIEQRCELFVVGGYVRDLLRGIETHDNDIDILVDGDALSFAESLHAQVGGTLKLFKDFYTAKILSSPRIEGFEEIDFASARSESYQTPGALPLVERARLSDDLKRRDFTVNAIALPLDELIAFKSAASSEKKLIAQACIDPHGGIEDLQNRIIRILHTQSFIDDPTRLFRALRYRERISGGFDQLTRSSFEDAIANGVLNTISFRRIFNELLKMLAEERAAECIAAVESSGLMSLKLKKLPLPSDSDLGYFLLLHFAGAVEGEKRTALYNSLSISKSLRARCESDLKNRIA